MRIAYNSFHGRFACNPRALYERLAGVSGLEHVWLADRAHADAFPDDVATVAIDSADATAVLEEADLLIANSHTEVEWDKRPGTTYLQTWHGTPMKRIHHDVLWAPEGRLADLDRDVAKWDVLLSPNAVSTPRLRKAFRFTGEIWETGYPRNDVLLSAEAEDLRRAVRDRLGLTEHQTAVLYAPTWRDDEFYADGDAPIGYGLDVHAYVDAMPGDHVLLVRAHNIVSERSTHDNPPGVLDVTHYPDVRDLYLAADVLVTDYSSVMFDFALTGKPMVFFTYDLENFRDQVRGFYFDFVPDAPGPVVSTLEDLVEALTSVASWRRAYRRRYDAFLATYSGLEDGAAVDRVLARLGLVPGRRSRSLRPGLTPSARQSRRRLQHEAPATSP
jgi:CDP-glycerol glycerophosphotransferase